MRTRRLLVLTVLSYVVVAMPVRGETSDPDPNRFDQEIEAFEQWDARNAVPDEPVLFVGSSSIRMWRTHESFPDLPVINRGFGGSQISDVLHFADRIVLPYEPNAIVFYAGDNDVAGRKSAERVLRDYRRFVARVRDRLPETRIVFLTIKPSGQRWALWPEMKRANELIAAYSAERENLHFADLATPLLGADGKPDDDLFLGDRLHLNAAGYAVWTKALRPILNDVLSRSGAAPSDR